jgi:hypothetical protein
MASISSRLHKRAPVVPPTSKNVGGAPAVAPKTADIRRVPWRTKHVRQGVTSMYALSHIRKCAREIPPHEVNSHFNYLLVYIPIALRDYLVDIEYNGFGSL